MNKPLICLLIDDDPDDHEIFCMALQQAFPEAVCFYALNCIQVTEQLKDKIIPFPDYIFMDWNLPYLEARECVACMRSFAELEKIPISILSGYVPLVDMEEMTELGLKKILKKQSSIGLLSQELIAAIN